jgi:hypothetical protein
MLEDWRTLSGTLLVLANQRRMRAMQMHRQADPHLLVE